MRRAAQAFMLAVMESLSKVQAQFVVLRQYSGQLRKC
jgi:hypothetical protein